METGRAVGRKGGGPCCSTNSTGSASNQELAGHYGISPIPALLIFQGGRIGAWHTGVTPEATLRTELERLRVG